MRVIAGTARSLTLKTLPGSETRPTTDRIKETLFNILQNEIQGSRFLDLFAGSGAIGIEALSRGAAEAVFVENNKNACRCILENLKFTRLEQNAVLYCGDVFRELSSIRGVFDLIFMDPPYGKQLERRVLEFLSVSSAADERTLIIAEASLDTDFSYLPDIGFETVRRKEYKTNCHMFIRKGRTSL